MTTVHTVKSKVKISQNFVAFSEYVYELYHDFTSFEKFLDKGETTASCPLENLLKKEMAVS